MKLPIARTKDILEQPLQKELLIYDLKLHKYYSLNETLTLIYRHCDGQTTSSELRQKHRKLSEEVILLAVQELSKENLLTEKIESPMSRRTLLNKAVVSAVALPVIIGLIAPTSTEAQSCLADGRPCSLAIPGACCGRRCNAGVCESQTCFANGQPCSLAVPGACCSLRCSIVGGSTVCVSSNCLSSGSPCSLANPGACCSLQCDVVNGNNRCV